MSKEKEGEMLLLEEVELGAEVELGGDVSATLLGLVATATLVFFAAGEEGASASVPANLLERIDDMFRFLAAEIVRA